MNKRSGKDYSDLADQLTDALVVVQGGDIRFISKGIEALLHYSLDELVGHPLSQLATAEHTERLEDFLEGRLSGIAVGDRDKRRIIFKARRKDGEELWMELRAQERDWEGEKVVTGLLLDISEHKWIEEKLRDRNRSQHMLLTNIPGMVYRSGMEREKTMEYLSLETERITGYSFDELMGSDGVTYAELIVPEDREKVATAVAEGIRSKESFVVDYRIVTKGGETRHIHEIGRGIYDESGVFICVEGVAFDVTEQRKAEERLIQAERLHAMGEMASGVAHDFNNVLTGILGRVQLLQFYERSEKVLSGLEVIEKAVRDGAEIVKRIQEFSRMGSGSNLVDVDLNSIIRDTVEITRARWKDEAEGRGVYVNIETHLNPIPYTKGNESELREVLTNLIFNAVDAIEGRGSIIIKSEQKGNRILVSVRDTGKGMSAKLQKKIFDPFFTTKGKGGTGLGLSVSYGIVHRHRGEITVESQENKGTTFTLAFAISRRRVPGEEKHTKGVKIEPKRIMIIEDVENVRETLKSILEIDRHDVISIKDGPTAVKEFKKTRPELVFTDLGLPEMNGWEVADRLHKIDSTVPIILCTGWGEDIEKEQMEKCGIRFVVGKPFDIDRLRSVIHEVQLPGR